MVGSVIGGSYMIATAIRQAGDRQVDAIQQAGYEQSAAAEQAPERGSLSGYSSSSTLEQYRDPEAYAKLAAERAERARAATESADLAPLGGHGR